MLRVHDGYGKQTTYSGTVGAETSQILFLSEVEIEIHRAMPDTSPPKVNATFRPPASK